MIDDAQKKRLLTIAPLHDLKETCKKMNEQQLLDLVYFAIDNELGNFDKASFLKVRCNKGLFSTKVYLAFCRSVNPPS